MKIAVIPARGESKRIPRKNVKSFYGKPMLAWSIETAITSGCFDKVIVSSEDVSILETAESNGAETPFRRPDNLAGDMVPTAPVIAHAIAACSALGWNVELACCIYPCAPFTIPSDLQSALSLLIAEKTNFVYPVCEYPHPIQRAMRRDATGRMVFFQPQHELTRTQDLEVAFHDAGQFYWGNAKAWLAKQKMHTDGVGMVVPSWRYVDIDNADDWKRAELLFPLIRAQSQESK